MMQQSFYIGKSWKGKIPHTWHFLNIRIPKPPYISSIKIIRLLNFLNFLGLSEENYNLQSLWITLQVCASLSITIRPQRDKKTSRKSVRVLGGWVNARGLQWPTRGKGKRPLCPPGQSGTSSGCMTSPSPCTLHQQVYFEGIKSEHQKTRQKQEVTKMCEATQVDRILKKRLNKPSCPTCWPKMRGS